MRSTLGRLTALTLALLLVIGVAACGDDDNGGGTGGDSGSTGQQEGTPAAKTGGEATMNLTSFPDSLDPALSYTQEGWQALWTVYTPLLSYKHAEGAAGSEIIPGLAEAMPEVSEDGKTYELKLREGLKYSDGSPVKATDFEHTIKRVLALESPGAGFYDNIVGAKDYAKAGRSNADIAGIDADDATREITIELVQVDGSFPYLLAMDFAGLVPGDTPFENQSKDPPPGAGPFKLTGVRQSRGYTLTKNANWTEIEGIPAARLDAVKVEVKKDQRRQTQDVIQNRVDYMLDPPPADQLQEVKARYKDRYEEFVTNSTYFHFMNERIKPFDDKRVRQAVNLAIDKPALLRIFGGLIDISCNFLPPGMQGYEERKDCPYGDPAKPPNIERARQLIKEAGVEGTKVTVYGNDENPSKPVSTELASTLRKIGLVPELKLIEGEVYFATIGNQRTKAAIGYANWFQDFPHPRNFTFLVDPKAIKATNNPNYSNVEDPQLARMLEEANRKPIEEAAPLYAQVDRRVVDEAHIAPYGHRKLANFVSERVDFENCTVNHPVNQLDLTQLCLR